jgi:hypothetical protein
MNRKFYLVTLIGTPRTDAQGVAQKDKDGNAVIQYCKTSKTPDEAFTALKAQGANQYYQCQLIEDEVSTVTTKSGKVVKMSNPQRVPFTLNVFKRRYPALFRDITLAMENKEFEQMTETDRSLNNLVVPGAIDDIDAGFVYYRMVRDAVTHKWKKFMTKSYGADGKIVESPVPTNRIQIFLYGTETDNPTVFEKEAITAINKISEKPTIQGNFAAHDQVAVAVTGAQDEVVDTSESAADVIVPE